MSKRYIVEVSDDEISQKVFTDALAGDLDGGVVLSYREFTETKSKKAVEESSILPTPLAASEPVQEPLNEADVFDRCSELSRQLALLSKKKPISQRK